MADDLDLNIRATADASAIDSVSDKFTDLAAAQVRAAQASQELRSAISALSTSGLQPAQEDLSNLAKLTYDNVTATEALKAAQAEAYPEASNGISRIERDMARATVSAGGFVTGIGGIGQGLSRIAADSETVAPVLAAAFPVLGAGIFLGVLAEGITKLHEYAEQAYESADAWTKIDVEASNALDSVEKHIESLQAKVVELTEGKLAALRLKFDQIGDGGTQMALKIIGMMDTVGTQIDKDSSKLALFRDAITGFVTSGTIGATLAITAPSEGEIIKGFGASLAKTLDTKGTAAGIAQIADEIQKVDALLAKTPSDEGLQRFRGALSNIRDLLAAQQHEEEAERAANLAEQAAEVKREAEKEEKERERIAKQAEEQRRRDALAELNDAEKLAKEKIKAEEEYVKENIAAERSMNEEIKRQQEQAVRDATKALETDERNRKKALAEMMKELKEAEKPWQELGRAINSGFDSMLRGVLMGTQTIGQAFSRLGADMLLVITEALAKMLLKYAAHWIAVNILEKTSATQRMGLLIAELTTKKAVLTTDQIAQATNLAGQAAAAAYASVMAALPFPINVATAPGVAAETFAQGLALGIPKAARGALLSSDSLISAHGGEMILPPELSRGMQKLVKGGGAGGGITYAPTIHAIDAQGVAEVLEKHADTLINVLRKQQREFRF